MLKGRIIVLPNKNYLRHPRGQFTCLREQAHTYHYKKDALVVAKSLTGATVERR
jgi:hypothetical protein